MKGSKNFIKERIYISNKVQKYSNQENYKYNNNYLNSLIAEILKANNGLKRITGNYNCNNINNVKRNIQNIFSKR